MDLFGFASINRFGSSNDLQPLCLDPGIRSSHDSTTLEDWAAGLTSHDAQVKNIKIYCCCSELYSFSQKGCVYFYVHLYDKIIHPMKTGFFFLCLLFIQLSSIMEGQKAKKHSFCGRKLTGSPMAALSKWFFASGLVILSPVFPIGTSEGPTVYFELAVHGDVSSNGTIFWKRVVWLW